MGLYSTYILSRLIDWSLGTAEVTQQRRLTLAAAQGNVLEIGFGTGLNLPHYPTRVCELTVLDSERMLPSRVKARIASAPFPVTQCQLDAGKRLPFADGSFDSIVTTWTLCSIAGIAEALNEIRRVLKPGGEYLFLEHGKSTDDRVVIWQNRLTPIHKLVGGGCHLNRPIDELIGSAGLKITTLDRIRIEGMPRWIGEVYRGAARSN